MNHSTSLLGLLKEFRGQNLLNFIPSAYAFNQRPNFLDGENQLQPNVKNTASVILCSWNGRCVNIEKLFQVYFDPNVYSFQFHVLWFCTSFLSWQGRITIDHSPVVEFRSSYHCSHTQWEGIFFEGHSFFMQLCFYHISCICIIT